MADSEVDTSRTTVRTYVPAYQREEWDDHADELDMSRSEFVRTMVQAGRRGFLDEAAPEPPDSESDSDDPVQGGSPDANPGGSCLEEQVLAVLSESEYLSWDELLAALTDDLEAQLESTLQELQAEGRVTYSGRNGGYTTDE
jgi:hypothetical protein